MSRKKGKSKIKGSAKGAAKGSAKGSAKSTSQHRAPATRPPSQPWPSQESRPFRFTLHDGAHLASNHRTTAFQPGKDLRHMPIQFVSAGFLLGTIKDRSPGIAPAEESRVASSSSPVRSDNVAAMAHMTLHSARPSPSASSLSSSSSSSGDEVVFRGRGQGPPAPVATSSPSPAHATRQLEETIAQNHRVVAKSQVKPSPPNRGRPSVQSRDEPSASEDGVMQDHFAGRRGGKPAWEGTTTEWQHRSKPNIGWLPHCKRPDMYAFLRGEVNPRDAAMDDYTQNVKESGLAAELLAVSGFAHREMDLDAGSNNDWDSGLDSLGEDSAEEKEDEPVNNCHERRDSWNLDRLSDFADAETSLDTTGTVSHILAKRIRRGDLQYLCVHEGHKTNDARWLPCAFLENTAEKQLIRAFEEQVGLRGMLPSSSSDESDEGTSDEDSLSDEFASDEDVSVEEGDMEEDAEFDDEALARALQRQEDLGLGSDEAGSHAGADYFDAPPDFPRSFLGAHARSRIQPSRGRRNRDPLFPSATAMADALAMDPYGGFDIMDTERPSLRYKKKGRRGQMPPELEDSDLNHQLQNTWEADRAKKRMKKAEREELRQQGLLGRKGKAPDLKVKYQGGVTMDDVVEEIREFLMGSMQTLSLPPMDAHRRLIIHQAASKFSLSSRSRGSGHNRFTVLSKTTHTRQYSDDEFDATIRQKGLLKRLQAPLHRGGGARQDGTFRQGGRNKTQTSYRDGETVGADAPVLGPGNKGHALLSKMGWCTGMALGAHDNKGILQPIAHTVKTNKAGLQ